jgi:Na+/melibiose symporter-like transporter
MADKIQIEKLDPSDAGIVLLCGQIADGLATPLIGFASDRTSYKFGR